MESENGPNLEDGSVIEKTQVEKSILDVKKGASNVDNGENVSNVNETPQKVTKPGSLNSSAVTVEASMTVRKSKIANALKEPGSQNGSNLKTNNTAKCPPNSKGPTLSSRNQRPSLSQSLFFPARGVRVDGTTSIDGYPMKTDAKHLRANGSEVPVSDKSVSLVSRLNNPKRRASTGVNSKEANTNGGGVSSRRTTLASIPTIQHTLPHKSGSVNATSNFSSSEASLSVNQNSKSSRKALLTKEDDDSHSTTSLSTPRGERRISGSGFAFQLDKRAEKRKEFFSKLEEKIQAKEMERTNLQAKSKENQEAEIKQLRKSLTFKATPMPNFYKEPPPKVELKKIPTTRAISPKLGRHKSTTAAANSSFESNHSCPSVRLNGDQSNSTKGIQANGDNHNVASKKPIKKSQSKIQSEETVATKTECPVRTQPKTNGMENHLPKACAGEMGEDPNQYVNLPEGKDTIKPESEKNTAQDGGPILSSLNPEIKPVEVAVNG